MHEYLDNNHIISQHIIKSDLNTDLFSSRKSLYFAVILRFSQFTVIRLWPTLKYNLINIWFFIYLYIFYIMNFTHIIYQSFTWKKIVQTYLKTIQTISESVQTSS